jgi:serine/threonine-protein kinase
MYEALTGVRPFVAKNYNALLVQILTVTPQPVERLNPEVPGVLGNIVRRALEKKRAVRYQSAGELRSALEPLLRARPRREIRSFGASGLPRVTVFGADDSSVGTDEEPTQEIERLDDRSDDETPIFGDGEKTVVDDPPSFQDTDATTETKRTRR